MIHSQELWVTLDAVVKQIIFLYHTGMAYSVLISSRDELSSHFKVVMGHERVNQAAFFTLTLNCPLKDFLFQAAFM